MSDSIAIESQSEVAECRKLDTLWQAVIDTALDCVITIDQDGRIIEFNPAAERTFGYCRAESIGRPMAEMIIPERHRRAHRKGMERYLATGKKSVLGVRVEIEALCADGHEIPVELAISPVKIGDQNYFTAYLRDISERHTQEAKIERAKRDSRDAVKAAKQASNAKSRFLAMMSHEIRTPLNGVLGSLGLLQDSSLDADQLSIVKTARASGQDLLVILNEILDFSKIEAGKLQLEPTAFDMAEMIEGLREFWANQALRKNLVLDFTIDADVAPGQFGDPGRIRQMLQNLIGNAIKFTETGQVTLRVRTAGQERVSAQGPDQLLLFEVIDSGSGIERGKQAQLYDEFTQLSERPPHSASGVGLGLAITRRLAELMYGTVGFESEAGRGSRFWFELPLRPADLPPTSGSSASKEESEFAQQAFFGHTRVLVAEDNATNQMVAKQMLERIGCTVDVVANGLEAVDAVASRPYSIVFMDISMPDLDGIEATRRIRALPEPSGKTPIYALTAYALKEDHDSYLAAGMCGVVTKPFSKAQIREALVAGSRAFAYAETTETVTSDGTEDAAGEQIFNPKTLDRLSEELGQATMQKLRLQFIADVRSCLAGIQHAVSGGQVELLERRSHTLSSVCGTFGAIGLGELARDVQGACLSGDTDSAWANARKFELLGTHTLQIFEQLVPVTAGRDASPGT